MSLIIVESPTKARTFNRILKSKKWGGDYYVFATIGHFRDLPSEQISVDVDHKFAPNYEIMDKKKNMVAKLKELAKEHKKIILATDLDREGESISYHVAYILGHVKENWPEFTLKKRGLERIIFHEITPKALEEALANPQELRIDLVKAQQARRILDRVVGYKISPILWKKTGRQWLSAGRVQTVALRLIVEREKEIAKFPKEEYYQLFGNFEHVEKLHAKLVSFKGDPYEVNKTITLFDGEYTYSKTTIDKTQSDKIQSELNSDSFKIIQVAEEVLNRYPPPPYTTSLLQQDAFQKLGYPSKLTMRLAQSLYEKGLITYHRTDSFNLSTRFVFDAMAFIKKKYGSEYALAKPRGYKTRSRNAQEAHEAIRPTRVDRTKPDKKLSTQEKKVYDLVYARALATQMKEAQVKQTKVQISSKKGYEFEAVFVQVLFDGFMKVLMPQYVEKNKKKIKFAKTQTIKLQNVDIEQKETRPPYRYNEATLIRTLEAKGIGRPSTYASIISLIVDKNYVEKEYRYFKSTPLGTAISDYLSSVFPNIFDLAFTANMEDSLDEIALGKKKLVPTLEDFYKPLKIILNAQKDDNLKLEIVEEQLDEKCPLDGGAVVVRFGKYGKFFACSNYPKCKYVKPNLRYVKGYQCPLDNGRLVVRYSKKGKRFYGCENYPKCKHVQWALNIPPKNSAKENMVTK
ncbi:DNA topoisomerase I [Candidatus Roizmanbacteria bacterium RIFCSPHIGHO2_01_FULL_38_15]|nr:MAG: DNA topoisomerase I [Candidatus Roizmanbacteria bacterium RIFCSPHIGHO2_01_FULL_38_15]